MPDPTTEDQEKVAKLSEEAGIADETAAYDNAIAKDEAGDATDKAEGTTDNVGSAGTKAS